MAVSYQVRLYSTAGQLQMVLDSFRSCTIEHRTNTPSTQTLGLFDDPKMVQYFKLDSLIEVRRRVPEADLDWYTEFIGFHRTPQHQITETDSQIFTSYSRGLLDLVRRRSIRYYSDTDGSAKGPAPADDVIKDYVRENAGPLALTSNNRLTDGVIPGLTIQANTSQASVYEGADAWRNLLEAITDIGEHNRVDFDVIWLGGASFEFRTYWPQLGTNRRAGTPTAVTFGIQQGNLMNPSHTVSRTDEITSVLVLGPGEGPLRDTTLVTAPPVVVSESPFNLIEQDQNASSEDREAALIAVGNQVLYEKRATVNFTFQPIQTPYSAYKRHYFLGDIVTCNFGGIRADVKITAITVALSEAYEQITLELQEETANFESTSNANVSSPGNSGLNRPPRDKNNNP